MEKWIALLTDNNLIGLKHYLKEGANVNECDEHEESVLALALKLHCDDEIIDLLIQAGADLFEINDEGVSIFDYAITYNNPRLFQHLIDEGIDINHTSRRSRFTPLMGTVCYARYEMAKTLLANGANKEARDSQGFTAEDFARKMRKTKMLELLT